jgi:hypothetical protein
MVLEEFPKLCRKMFYVRYLSTGLLRKLDLTSSPTHFISRADVPDEIEKHYL